MIKEEWGDTMEMEELPSSEEMEEAEQQWWRLEEEMEQQRLDEEEMEAAAHGLRWSCQQRGVDTKEGVCSEGVRVECQAWKETTLIA